MKIAIIAASYPPHVSGGGEISAQLLVKILTAAGAEVSVLTCGFEPSVEESSRAMIRRVKSPNIYWTFEPDQPSFKKLVWHLKENFNPLASSVVSEFLENVAPDIVVTSTIQNFGAEAWSAPHKLGIPIVHILRSYYPFCWRSSAVRNNENCAGHCVDCTVLTVGRRRASRYVSGVIGISEYIAKRHREEGLFKTADTVIIPEPVSESVYASESRRNHRARFGFLGILSANKGLEPLAKAWAQVTPGTGSLSIAGRGTEQYTKSIRSLFSEGADFAGWVDSSQYLETIDYLIVPSIWNEPFGRIVVEAFSRGVPVIGSRIGGIPEIIQDGRNGFLFTPGDADDLAKLIGRAIALPQATYQSMSANALVDSRSYEARGIATKHMEFYSKIINEFRTLHNAGARELS